MAYKILFTEDALADLESVLDYIRADNESAAETFGVTLLKHIEVLQEFPRIGTPVPQRPNVRKLQHPPIRIYYRLYEHKHLIEILHFWHGARREPPL